MRNLTHFDVEIGGTLYPAAEAPLLLDPILSSGSYVIGGCPVRELYGFLLPDFLEQLPDDGDPRVIVPRLAPVIALAREVELEPLTIPLRLIGDRGRPGPVVLASEEELEEAPSWLAVDYPQIYGLVRSLVAGDRIARVVKGNFPIRVRGGETLPPVPDEMTAHDLPVGVAVCPEVPPNTAAVLAPHSGPIVREYARRGLAVLVTSILGEDGQVDLYRVA